MSFNFLFHYHVKQYEIVETTGLTPETRMRDVWAIVGLSGNVGDFWGTDTLQAGLEAGGTSIHPRALPLDVATFLCGAQPNLAQPVDFVDFPITDRRRQLTPVAPREQGHNTTFGLTAKWTDGRFWPADSHAYIQPH